MEKTKYTIAIHEAAHFLADINEGRKPKYATIVPEGESLGHVRSGRTMAFIEHYGLSEKATISHIFAIMAGPMAENRHTGEYSNDHDAIKDSVSDWDTIVDFLISWGNSQRLYDRAFNKATRWVDKNMPEIQRVAAELYQNDTVDMRCW